MPTKLPDDFDGAGKPRKKVEPDGLWTVRDALSPKEKRERDNRIEQIKFGTLVLIIGAISGAWMYTIAKAKEETRTEAFREQQRKKALNSSGVSETKNQSTTSQNLPSTMAIEPAQREPQPTEWEETGMRLETSSKDDFLVVKTPKGAERTEYDKTKAEDALLVADCVLESPFFTGAKPQDFPGHTGKGRQVVLDAKGKRYTAITWNDKEGDARSADILAVWERPKGTSGKSQLATYSDVGLDGVVDDGSMGDPKGTNFKSFNERQRAKALQAEFQERYDKALDAFLHAPQCDRFYRTLDKRNRASGKKVRKK